MEHIKQGGKYTKKRSRPTVRPITVGLYLLRIKELSLSIMELELLTMGEVTDMLIEKSNDSYEWELAPTQADFERFGG